MFSLTHGVPHIASQSLGPFKVVSIERASVFAGKLGNRVTETMKVQRDGDTYRVIIAGAVHTRMAWRKPPQVKVGDTVQFQGILSRGVIRTTWDGVKRASR